MPAACYDGSGSLIHTQTEKEGSNRTNMNKRLLSLAMAAMLMFLPLAPVYAAHTPVKELAYAYIETSAPYLTIGQPFTFTVRLPEDPAPYKFKYGFFHNPDVQANEDFAALAYTKELAGEYTFSVTPTETGKYFLQVEISDDDYRYIKLDSQPLFGYEASDVHDPATLPGKVAQLTQEGDALGLGSGYERALWLNDWLIYHADYDESMEMHHPEGVLLNGTGVCESYALAYQILLQEAGIDSLYLTGYSRGESHAWNLVSLDGQWYYIDTTWNDPKGGGAETHDYFGLTDALFSRDHDWSISNFIPPKASDTRYNYNLLSGYLPFEDAQSLGDLLSKALDERQSNVLYSYQGSDRYFDTQFEVKRWMDANALMRFAQSWTFGGSAYNGYLDIAYNSDEGYLGFADEAEFSALMENQLAQKPDQVRVNYNGADRYFMIRGLLDRWLSDNYARFGITAYQYSYTDYMAQIDFSY